MDALRLHRNEAVAHGTLKGIFHTCTLAETNTHWRLRTIRHSTHLLGRQRWASFCRVQRWKWGGKGATGRKERRGRRRASEEMRKRSCQRRDWDGQGGRGQRKWAGDEEEREEEEQQREKACTLPHLLSSSFSLWTDGYRCQIVRKAKAKSWTEICQQHGHIGSTEECKVSCLSSEVGLFHFHSLIVAVQGLLVRKWAQMSTFSFCPSGQRDWYKERGGGGRERWGRGSGHMADEINGGKTDKAG